jgi:AraC family transcriptional regulator of adaptative response/methylated-DNA-[protein]-cysteine methyltransferase
MLDERTCWEAVLRKDAGQDGRFYFGVLTTGVYCRPSCPARKPRRENVRFYAAPEAAEKDGLRACLRCRPKETPEVQSEKMGEICDFIRQAALSGEPVTLEVLSERAGMSPFRFQRVFRAALKVTPRQYLQACRFEALKKSLRSESSVTDAIYEAGFGSSSRVYEQTDARLGMTPAEYQAGGRNLAISCASFESPVGRLMVGATDRGLCFVQFGDSHETLLAALREEYPEATIETLEAPFEAPFHGYVEALRRHLAGDQPHLDLPVAVRATAFELKVWSYLQSIPYAEKRSYSAVAAAVGQPNAARAVARACAANRVALVIPCHRVIRANGDPGGYRWGLERKKRLLEGERTSPRPGSSSRAAVAAQNLGLW